MCTNKGRLFQTVRAQHENRRAAMFVDEECVDSRSGVDDLRTRELTTVLNAKYVVQGQVYSFCV